MPRTPVKQCPECGSSVAIKKSMCVCGHSFRRNPPVYARRSKRVAMQQNRALETTEQCLHRKQADKAYQSNRRAMETDNETLHRLEHKRAYTANKRSSETSAETLRRQEQNQASMAKKRALETPAETLCRQERIRACMSKKRASETPAETLCRQEQIRACMSKKRASETPAETLCRQEQIRACMSKKRALETPVETIQRRELNRVCMVEQRSLLVPMDKCIADFQTKVKEGPEFVCTCCHRMMYRQTVVPYTKTKYTKASSELLEQIFSATHTYISSDGKQWVCKTCDAALKRGNLPLQAKANELQLCPVPSELANLNMLELRLISLRVPFMKMVALPSGKQRCIHGPAVNPFMGGAQFTMSHPLGGDFSNFLLIQQQEPAGSISIFIVTTLV